jgi:hypothetical protein
MSTAIAGSRGVRKLSGPSTRMAMVEVLLAPHPTPVQIINEGCKPS